MSQKAYDELMAARDRLFKAQRQCAWCDHRAQSSDGLVRHILENHSADRGPLSQDEKDLLALLQKEDAK